MSLYDLFFRPLDLRIGPNLLTKSTDGYVSLRNDNDNAQVNFPHDAPGYVRLGQVRKGQDRLSQGATNIFAFKFYFIDDLPNVLV